MPLPQDECQTRAPIHFEYNPLNWLLQMFGTASGVMLEDPGLFDKLLQSLREFPPDVMVGSGFVGAVPFDWGYRGAIMGQYHPLLGASTMEAAHPCAGFDRLSPIQLADRISMIEQYVAALHGSGRVKRVMPYIDFGTQLFGRHARPTVIPDPCSFQDLVSGECQHLAPNGLDCSATVSPSAWGFWDFYDHWDDYAQPTGPFGLGPKPPDPTAWLARWHDPNAKQQATYPDEFTGFSSPGYAPRKCCNYGPTYRYAVCLNTEGWALWWTQVVQWAARVGYDGLFVDNAFMTPCWNEECQQGYREWLQQTFTGAEIQRFFATDTAATRSLLSDSSVEGPWSQVQLADGSWVWQATSWSFYPAVTTGSPIFPDIDAVHGRYCCRIEARGGGSAAVFSHITQDVPAGLTLRLTFSYRTQGVVTATVFIGAPDQMPPRVLDLAEDWIRATIDFHTPPDASGHVGFSLRFEVIGSGNVWLDDFWLGPAATPRQQEVRLELPFGEPLRAWAAGAYRAETATRKLGYLRDQGRLVSPEFAVFANGFHAEHADYFMTEGHAIELEDYRYDVGFPPGLYVPYDPPVELKGSKSEPYHLLVEPMVVTNTFDYKYLHSRRVPDFFGYHMPMWFHAAEKGFYDHNPDSALLNLAEAAAFGGGAGCDSALLRHNYDRYDADPSLLAGPAAAIRAVEGRFWAFIRAQKHRYGGYRTLADVGIVFHDVPARGKDSHEFNRLLDLATGLASRGVLWDVLTENRCHAGQFSHLRVLIYQDVTRISSVEAQAVLDFVGQGGLVIAGGVVGDDDEWFRMRLPDPAQPWPPVGSPPTDNVGTRARPPAVQLGGGTGKLIYEPIPLKGAQVVAEAEAHLDRTVQMIGNVPVATRERLRLNAWVRDQGGGTITVHVLNYAVPLGKDQAGQVQSVDDVHVSVPVPPQMQVQGVQLLSPEADGPPMATSFAVAQGLLTFKIPSLRVYTMAVIE